MESGDQALQRAIATISQSDPHTRLLEQVKLGQMKPTDAGFRAVTGSWMGTYQKVIELVDSSARPCAVSIQILVWQS